MATGHNSNNNIKQFTCVFVFNMVLRQGVSCNEKQKAFILYHIISERKRRKCMQEATIACLVTRRKLIINACLLALSLVTNTINNLMQLQNQIRERAPRSCRRHTRNKGWWENVWTFYPEVRFKETFRISKATFLYILGKIRHDIKKDVLTEDLISPECRLDICLYRLGRGDYFLQFQK